MRCLAIKFPTIFLTSGKWSISARAATFADGYGTSCDLTNPDELREEASCVGNVGDLLKVDTDSAQESLR